MHHEQSYESPYNQDEPTECETWISCAGHLHYLKTKLHTSEAILNEIESTEKVHEEYFLIQMKELVEQLNKSSKQLLKASTNVLETLESSKGSLDNNSQYSTLPLLDPGERSTNLTEVQKRYLIRVGPYQPVLPEYPVTTRVAGENLKQSRFSLTWFKENPHLEYSILKDTAFCFVCSWFGGGPGMAKADNAWVEEGFRTWHKVKSVGSKTEGKLSKHFSSLAHKSAHLSYAHFAKTCGHVDVLLDKAKRVALIQEDDDCQQNRRVIEILLDITRTLAKMPRHLILWSWKR